ncbi:hypothetical protein HU200_033114 [Digitaria exilis]|uniref:DUF1618 domain-containing protein n=1 Tax=Digitaria exilis TaxID=1010633 RepID=A0A835BX99_9POAL|nr:hypothetical protein HU200_033114 [Digitaria exilis]
MEECDYFIYQIDDLPSLKLLPHPHPAFIHDDEVGIVPHGDQHTIAALVGTDNPTVFTLHTFRSEIGSWTSITMSLDAPQDYPRHVSCHVPCLSDIWTHTVITLGGEGGTMGWVDLWRGILLCDVCGQGDINLRFVPVPLPMEELNRRNMDGCSGKDKETGYIAMRFDGWTIRTWSNFSMTESRDDWKMDRRPVHAKNIKKSRKMHLQLRDALESEKSSAAGLQMNLKNLCVSDPTPSMSGRNVVYLPTKAKFMHTKACVLAVDMENMKLQYVVDFGAERQPDAGDN